MASVKLMNTIHAVVANVFEYEDEYMALMYNMQKARAEYGFGSTQFHQAYDAIGEKSKNDLNVQGYGWTEEFNDIIFTILAVIYDELLEEEA